MTYLLNQERKQKIRHWLEEYERHISLAVFFLGFVWDNFFIVGVTVWYDNLVIIAYLCITLGCIILLNIHDVRGFTGRRSLKAIDITPYVMQFAFGGLFNAFSIFYYRAGSLSGSWPFLCMLAFLLVANEFFRERYRRLIFPLSVYFICLYSYLIFAIPVILRTMGPWIFLLSGAASLFFMAVVIALLYVLIPAPMRQNIRMVLTGIGIVYLGFNALYFTNAIPPIPLYLKNIGVYHSVQRTQDGYAVMFEPAPWYDILRDTARTVHSRQGSPVYVFSAVEAPTRLNATIVHHWRHYDDKKKKWTDQGRYGFPIIGGREEGYRGYTMKSHVTPGKWRVDVETDRGQLLGSITFTVVEADAIPALTTGLK